jgi:hypothetical protein
MFIVDSHHKVLSAWAHYRATLVKAPRLLTLDHHTDTSEAFRNHTADAAERASLISQIDFNQPASVEEAISRLSHDEHIVAAIKSDIISSAFVIAHKARDTDIEIYREHKIVCCSVNAASSRVLRSDCDRVLESEFLNERIVYFNAILDEAKEVHLLKESYILDIDLDFLNTLKAAIPEDISTLQRLARGAGLITIATEADHVKHCALDLDLTSEILLGNLLKILGA